MMKAAPPASHAQAAAAIHTNSTLHSTLIWNTCRGQGRRFARKARTPNTSECAMTEAGAGRAQFAPRAALTNAQVQRRTCARHSFFNSYDVSLFEHQPVGVNVDFPFAHNNAGRRHALHLVVKLALNYPVRFMPAEAAAGIIIALGFRHGKDAHASHDRAEREHAFVYLMVCPFSFHFGFSFLLLTSILVERFAHEVVIRVGQHFGPELFQFAFAAVRADAGGWNAARIELPVRRFAAAARAGPSVVYTHLVYPFCY